MRRITATALAIMLSALSPLAAADTWDNIKDGIAYNFDQSKRAFHEGQWDLYVPLYTFHAPWAYSAQNRSEQNDWPWGAGFGRSVVDDKGNTQGLYAMAFSDSHYKPQYNVGYAWMTYWGPSGGLQGGVGYTLFFFSRSDIGNYWPIPAALPLVSARYQKVELYGTYVPSFGGGNGSVGFFFARVGF